MEILKLYFGKTLYYKRLYFGISQEAMAEKCCISLRQYIDIENGKRLPSFKSLINIIIKSGIDLDEFIKEIQEEGYTPEDYKNVKNNW